jgi:hypothetical protein
MGRLSPILSSPPSQWTHSGETLALLCSHETFMAHLRAVSRDGPDLRSQLSLARSRPSLAQQGSSSYEDSRGLLSFTHWLLRQRVSGPHVRASLSHLIARTYSRLDDLSIPEKDNRLTSLAQQISNLMLSDSNQSGK